MFDFKRTILTYLVSLINISCINFNSFKQEYIIKSNQWTNKDITFADISKSLARQKKINKNWSKLNSSRSIPYFKLKNARGKILGNYTKNNEKYLIVQLNNNKKYKWKNESTKGNPFPSHIALFDDVANARSLIGRSIWLNDIFVDSIFINRSGSSFEKFQKVDVVGTKIYQNSKIDLPIWLEIKVENEISSYIRYNGKFKFHSRQNNYFIANPIKNSWDEDIIKKVIKGNLEYGMNHEQVRASIGNPDIINNTSSRHGVSQQWIYGNDLVSKRYLLFENGKLSTMQGISKKDNTL